MCPFLGVEVAGFVVVDEPQWLQPVPGWMTTAGTVPSTADRSAMRSSACSMLWARPGFHVEVGPQAGQCGDVVGAAAYLRYGRARLWG